VQPPKRRGEDAAVAFTWWDFLNHPDEPERILFFPMTRAASRAMDAITEFSAKNVPGSALDKFLVSGASKRGFITWFTAATDSRVVAAAPIVMDLLNTQENIMHLFRDYNGFSFAFADYCTVNLTKDLTNGKFPALGQHIDPLNYKENLTMPKLVIDSTGDEFFALDDDHYWWGMLDGETKRLMVANAEHSMATGVIPLITGLDAFYQSIIDGSPRPEIGWTMANGTGQIDFYSPQMPNKVVMRFSQTLDGKRRDFRLVRGDTPADPCVPPGIPVKIFGDGKQPFQSLARSDCHCMFCSSRPSAKSSDHVRSLFCILPQLAACAVPIIWIGEDIGSEYHDAQGYHFLADMPEPEVGWRGFLVEAYWDGPANTTFKFTSQVSIVPQTLPYEPCTTCDCTLV
jgi:PhoPQ-activated pathogenicity-related protein